MKNNAEKLIKQAEKNLAKWGDDQSIETLGLAIAEECGELAQAILRANSEGGDARRIHDEAVDLGSLTLQVMRKLEADSIDGDPDFVEVSESLYIHRVDPDSGGGLYLSEYSDPLDARSRAIVFDWEIDGLIGALKDWQEKN